VECDLLDFNPQNNSATGGDICGGPNSVGGQNPTRYGRDPYSLDASGELLGLTTTYCGSTELAIPAEVQAYCSTYGDTLLDGWGRRRSEWQLGLGVQHELLPRLSAEVTYNRRSLTNLTTTDTLGIGCDRFAAVTLEACNETYLNYTHPDYGFFSVTAPSNPNLPGGGGYVVRGLTNPNATLPSGNPNAITILKALEYSWNGVDTNFTWRAPRGLRINGGTSTGRAVRDLCRAETDAPNVQQHDGVTPACNPHTRWETNVRGTAAYTIPWVDVLASTVFQWRPGVEREANYTFTKDEVVWAPASADRATQACPAGATAGQVGCFTTGVGAAQTTATTRTINLLNPGEMYGEGYSLFDVKFGKNFRFQGKRVNVGVDIFNIFNNDAVRSYQDQLDITDNPNTTVVEQYGQATGLLSPRFVRLSVQFDF
jgi:hypothetical protein